jgi:DNA processing protein
MVSLQEQAAVLALVSAAGREWHRVASIIEEEGSALRILQGETRKLGPADPDLAAWGTDWVARADISRYEDLIRSAHAKSIEVLTVLDSEYPINLRQVFNRPPFLMSRGHLNSDDRRAVAIVGTRKASRPGLDQARRLARDLSDRGITVLSGLALGIDTAAHMGALDGGGRTIAVLGTGIERIYPPENTALAESILSHGALVSQFWPSAPPTRYSFPMRNVVMSGLAIGTVVIEASSRSGAKMQARLALEHGKRLFLVESLVMQEEWAKRYAKHPGTTVVRSVDDVTEADAPT